MKTSLSVVIPFHNEEENVKRVVREIGSTLRAASIPFELICVNSGSTDATPAIISALACDVAGLSEHERDAALGALTAWAMVSAAPGWRDIALEEKDVFVPVPPVEYWMPVATSPNNALHLTSGVGGAHVARR